MLKKLAFKKLAFLGIAGGMAASAFAGQVEHPSLDMQHLLARPACKGPNGCGGLTADRDVSEDADDDSDEDADEKGKGATGSTGSQNKNNTSYKTTPSRMIT